MNISDITLKDIQYVLALAQYVSFSQAAAACSISQPALSKQIKAIETVIGVPLFERDKRHVMLTSHGTRFVKQAQIVMDEAGKLWRVTLAGQELLSGVFRLGIIASSCPYLLPLFVEAIKAKYPKLQLIIQEGLTDNLIQELRQGHLDAVIAATTLSEIMLQESLIHHIPLFFEPFLLAYKPQDGQRYKLSVVIEEIDTQRLLLLEDGHCLKDQTLELCSLKDNAAALSFKATSLETLLQMTAAGFGISVIPKLAAQSSSQFNGLLRFSEFKNRKTGRSMALYYRKSYPWKQNIESLSQFIQQQLPVGITRISAAKKFDK